MGIHVSLAFLLHPKGLLQRAGSLMQQHHGNTVKLKGGLKTLLFDIFTKVPGLPALRQKKVCSFNKMIGSDKTETVSGTVTLIFAVVFFFPSEPSSRQIYIT